MVDTGTVVTLAGLGLDVVGAGIIALPDVPHLRKYHRPGRTWRGLRHLELAPLLPGSTGFEEIKSKINEMADISVGDEVEEIHLEAPSLTLGSNTGGVHRKITIQRRGDNEPIRWEDTDFRFVRRILMDDIRKGEAKMRAVGFLLLAIGFICQMFGVVL